MPSASTIRSKSAVERPPARLAGTTRYDDVAALIVSLLILLGVAVGVMFFIWLGSKLSVHTRTVPVTLQAEPTGGVASGTSAEGMMLDAPTVQEIQRETQIALPEFRRTLSAVDDLLATNRAELETTLDRLEQESAGGGKSVGTGNAPAFGEGAGTGGFPRSVRWEIRFASGETLEEYRRELDHFGIELGAVSRDGGVEYVRHFTRNPPMVERNRSAPESRLYMQWRRGSARLEADRKLLESAGVSTSEKTLVQFIPTDLEDRLARLEFDFAKRAAGKIRKTRFATRPIGTGYEFFVEDQTPL